MGPPQQAGFVDPVQDLELEVLAAEGEEVAGMMGREAGLLGAGGGGGGAAGRGEGGREGGREGGGGGRDFGRDAGQALGKEKEARAGFEGEE
jgi:hypothetical protein